MASEVKATTSRGSKTKTAGKTGTAKEGTAVKSAAKTSKTAEPAAKKPRKTATPATSTAAVEPPSRSKKAPPVVKAPAEKRVVATAVQITAADRIKHIEVAAYYIAEKRGFAPGNPEEDWHAAEKLIDSLLLKGNLPG